MLDEKWGYIWGTAGEMWTAEKQKNLENHYDADDPNRGMSVRYGKKWIGHRVADCSGVLVFIYKQFGLSIPHGSSSMVRQKYIVDCGPTPHPGWAALVDPTPDTPDNKHIGVVGPDGKTVYESKGTQAGFTTSSVTDKKWKKFGRLAAVDYNSGEVIPMVPIYQARVTTSGGSLRLRSGPSTSSQTLAKIPNGTVLDIYKDENGWSETVYNGTKGYCSDEFLTKIGGDTPDVEPAERTVLVRSDGTEIALEGLWSIRGHEG